MMPHLGPVLYNILPRCGKLACLDTTFTQRARLEATRVKPKIRLTPHIWNIRLSCKLLTVTNAIAYSGVAQMTRAKSFIVSAFECPYRT
jgi:hypothetical protein